MRQEKKKKERKEMKASLLPFITGGDLMLWVGFPLYAVKTINE